MKTLLIPWEGDAFYLKKSFFLGTRLCHLVGRFIDALNERLQMKQIGAFLKAFSDFCC